MKKFDILYKEMITKLNGETPENINKMYEKNIKYCKLSNCLVYNLRIYTLFVLLLSCASSGTYSG